MFFKLLRYDLKVGILYRYKKFLIAAAVYFFDCLDYYMKFRSYSSTETLFPVDNSFGNMLMYIFAGKQAYDPQTDIQFIFPAFWLLLYFTLAYFTLYYPYRDLEENGQNVLLRSGGRRLWWTSKCLWNIITVVLFFAVGWFVILTVCLVQRIPLVTGLSANINMLLEMRVTSPFLYPENLMFEILFLPMLTMIAMNLAEMTLSLFIRPIYSFVLTGVMLIVSAYYQSPFLIGDYAMPVRSSRMIADGVDPLFGALLSAGIAVLSFFAGLLYFKRYDVFGKENVN